MALSFKEKRPYQKAIKEAAKALAVEGITFKEKRPLQKAIKTARDMLAGKNASPVPATRLDRLLAGKYKDYDPVPFIELVESIVTSEEADVSQIKQPVIDYYEHNMAA